MSKKIGDYYEKLAKKFLIKKSYLILEENYYSIYGEIDLICEKDNTIVFVEVKYRKNSNYGLPREAVTFSKQNKIKKTSLDYISKKNILNKNFRYDIIEILGDNITHIENGFY